MILISNRAVERFRWWLAAAAISVAVDASPASLERLVMPGPLVEDHADLEDECGKCHRAFVPGEQAALCLDCHETVEADVEGRRGFHGLLYRDAPDRACRDCHTEHKGRAADIVGLDRDTFDHDRTDFPLGGAHRGLDCAGCHRAEQAFRDAPVSCSACHREDEPHRGRLGEDCAGCHAEDRRWQDTRFDHSTTGFDLQGAHRKVECRSCHVDEVWDGLPGECSACHAAADVHRGGRGSDCGRCHDASGWSGAGFDHRAETGFALTGRHGGLACAACHLEAMALAKPPTACVGCHSAEDRHRGRFGADCDDCHRTSTWKKEFDHRAETGFALLGAHAPLACERCHRGKLEETLPDSCVGCHEPDDPHAGRYRACADCHSEATWHDVAFDHAFTRFPLIGLHSAAACETCHSELDFAKAPSDCADCHGERDVHGGAFGAACADCHNPNGWDRWQFDHDAQTTYPLTGSHRGLSCAACHDSSTSPRAQLSRDCHVCHRDDDRHEGRFGADCARCHTTESFADPSLWQR